MCIQQDNLTMRHWLLFIAAFMLLSTCGGGSSSSVTPAATLDLIAAEGMKVFNQDCAACHALTPDTIIVGPSLAGVAGRAASRMLDLDAKQYLELSILKPEAYVVKGFSDMMPKDFGKKLTGEQLDALVAFLMTLK
jgi:nitric oxide reductase subunit C